MITLISGTNRPGSATRKIARHIEGIYQSLHTPLAVVDLLDLPPELFSNTSYDTKPASFQPFIDQVLNAAGLIVVTPEYNGGFPGVLKYFIDMLPFPKSLQNRPVCFVGLGAGEWGGLRPVEQLQAIFAYRNAFMFPDRVFIKGVHKLLDSDGRLTSDDIVGRLQTQARGFIDFVKRIS